MDCGADPCEGLGRLVVGMNEGIDLLSDLAGRCEAGAAECRATENGEPDLDLVEPAGVGRREVEVDVRMLLEPGQNFRCLVR